MKVWNFQVNKSPKEIGKKLESSLGGVNRIVLKINYNDNQFVKFRIRKRLLLAFEIISQNNILVNGQIFKASGNETDVKISFALHPLSKLLLYGHIILGLGLLAAIILEVSSSSYIIIVGGFLLATGILFGLHLQKVFDKHVQEYKTLISGVLEI